MSSFFVAAVVTVGSAIATGVAAVGAAIASVGTAVAGAVGLTGLSTVAVTAIGTGVISGAVTAIQGGSLEDVLKSAVVGGATSYVGGSVGNYVSKSVTAGLSGGIVGPPTAGVVAAGNLAGNVAAGVTRSAIMGQDLERGALLGVAASTTSLLNVSPEFRNLPDSVKSVVSASASTLIRGGDVKEAAVMAAITSGNIVQKALAQSPELKAYMEDPKNKYATEIALTTMNTALAASLVGGDVSKSTEDALIVASIDQMSNAFKEEYTTKVSTAQKKYAEAQETQKKLEPNHTKQKQYAAQYEKTYAELESVEKTQNAAIDKYNVAKSDYDKLNESGYIENDAFYVSKRTELENGDVVYSEPTDETTAYNKKVAELNTSAEEANKQIAAAKTVFDEKLPQLKQIESDLGELQQIALPLEQVYAAQVEDVNKYTNDVVTEGQKFVTATNKSIISTLIPDFNAKEYAKINALSDGVDPYTHYINFGKKEDAPISYSDAVSRDFADYGLTAPPSITKDFVSKMSTSDNPADALDDYFAERTLTPEEVMVQAKKVGVTLSQEEAVSLSGFGDKTKLSDNLGTYLTALTKEDKEFPQYGEKLAGLADTIVDGKYVVDVKAAEGKETDPYLFPDSGSIYRVGSGQKASAPYTFTNQLGESFVAADVTHSDGSVYRVMYDPATDTHKQVELTSASGEVVGGNKTLPEVGVTATPETFDVSKLTPTERDELLRSSVISQEERAALIAAQKSTATSNVGQLTAREILDIAKQKAIKGANDIKIAAVQAVGGDAAELTAPITGGTTGTTGGATETVDGTIPTTGGTTTTTGGTTTTTPTTGGTTVITPPKDTTTPPPPPLPTDTTTTPKTDTTTPPIDTPKPPTDTPKPPTDTTTPPPKDTTMPTGGVGDIVKPTPEQLQQRQQRTNQLMSLLGLGGGGQQQQQINVKAPELAKINYIYDISGPSIFAGPQGNSLYGTETGTVDDLQKIMKR